MPVIAEKKVALEGTSEGLSDHTVPTPTFQASLFLGPVSRPGCNSCYSPHPHPQICLVTVRNGVSQIWVENEGNFENESEVLNEEVKALIQRGIWRVH